MSVKIPSTKSIKQDSPGVVTSPSSTLRLLYPAPIELMEGESDYSGYDADCELGSPIKNSPVDTVLEGRESEEEKAVGVGGSWQSPLVTVRVPEGVKRRLWMESPVWQCVELLKESLEGKDAVVKW